jgi:RNA polymerase sigma factor (sigma-70 family)
VLRRTLLKLGGDGPPTDSELLNRFVSRQDAAAFDEIVRRHGLMVLRVCQRVLRQAQDAEDAFQATFIVLARKATAVATMASIGGWLHGVACRTAWQAKKTRAGRIYARETPFEGSDAPASGQSSPVSEDWRPILDEELSRLPEKYRAPLVLCYFEGKTVEEVARHLGCQANAVHKRLQRARERLRGRLERRGVALSAGALMMVLGEEAAPAALPVSLVAPVVEAAKLATAGRTTAGLSPGVAALADATVRSMAARRLRTVAALVAAVILIGGLSAGIAPLLPPAPPAAVIAQGQRQPTVIPGMTGTLVFSPDGKTLAAGSMLCDLVTGQTRRLHAPKLTMNELINVDALGFSADGKTLITWRGRDRPNLTIAIEFWDVASGAERRALARPMKWSTRSSQLAVSGDGQYLVAYHNDDRTVKVRRTTSEMDLVLSTDVVEDTPRVIFSPDSKFLGVAMGRSTGQVNVYDLAKSKLRAAFKVPVPAGSLAFSPDGKSLAVTQGSNETEVTELRDVSTGAVRSKFPGGARAFSPDGKSLATVMQGQRIHLWDVATGKERVAVPPAENYGIRLVTFSADGKKLAWCENYHRPGVWVWEIAGK